MRKDVPLEMVLWLILPQYSWLCQSAPSLRSCKWSLFSCWTECACSTKSARASDHLETDKEYRLEHFVVWFNASKDLYPNLTCLANAQFSIEVRITPLFEPLYLHYQSRHTFMTILAARLVCSSHDELWNLRDEDSKKEYPSHCTNRSPASKRVNLLTTH